MFIASREIFYKVIIIFLVALLLFMISEPVVTFSASSSEQGKFIVTQEITGELSLTLGTTTVEMTGSIGGVVGGNATGTNYAVITANSGYILTIAFENNPAMLGDNLASGSIVDYDPATSEPDFNMIASTSAVFAYTVASDPSADLDSSFKDNSTACGVGGTNYTANRCWQGPSTSAYTVVDRSSGTGSGTATTTFTFVVNVPANPVPTLPADTYTATTTLTATIQ